MHNKSILGRVTSNLLIYRFNLSIGSTNRLYGYYQQSYMFEAFYKLKVSRINASLELHFINVLFFSLQHNKCYNFIFVMCIMDAIAQDRDSDWRSKTPPVFSDIIPPLERS